MDTLEQARAEIDAVDAQLAALFERRMAAVLSVAQYKQAHGLPVYDAAREAVVLEKAAARIQNAALRPYYKDHVQNMMDIAKQYEAEVLGRNRAAYQGVEGAFAHIALRALFPHAEAVSCPTWDEVFDAVNGKTSGAFQNRYHRIAGGIVGGDLLALCECEQGNADRLILRQRLADDLTVLGIYQTG